MIQQIHPRLFLILVCGLTYLILVFVGMEKSHAQVPKIDFSLKGGCSDSDPTFRIQGGIAEAERNLNLTPVWVLPAPRGEEERWEFLDFQSQVNTSLSYRFELRDPNQGGRVVLVFDTTVQLKRPRPVPFEWSPDIICGNEEAVEFRVLSSLDWKYTWIIEGTKQGPVVEHTFSRLGTFSIRVYADSDSNGCRTPVNQKEINVYHRPDPVINVGNRLGCSTVMDGKAEFTFTVTSFYPAAEQQNNLWTHPSTGDVIENTAQTLKIRLPTGIHSISHALVIRSGCSGSATQEFDLVAREHPKPTFTRNPDEDTICVGMRQSYTNTTFYPDPTQKKESAFFANNKQLFDSSLAHVTTQWGSVVLRHYDIFILPPRNQCIFYSEPKNFYFHGPAPLFFADDSSKGICSLPDTSLLNIKDFDPNVDFTWTIYDLEGNTISGYPKTIRGEAIHKFILPNKTPESYTIKLERSSKFGCNAAHTEPAFVIVTENIVADFDWDYGPKLCMHLPKESILLKTLAKPAGHGLENQWFRHNGSTGPNDDGYRSIGIADSLEWGGVTPGFESIKLKVNNYNQCADSIVKERIVEFISPDTKIIVDPPFACPPITYKIKLEPGLRHPADWPVITNLNYNGIGNLTKIDSVTYEVHVEEDGSGTISIDYQFGQGFQACSDKKSLEIKSGLKGKLENKNVVCVGAESNVTSNPALFNTPTSYEWMFIGDAEIEVLDTTSTEVKFRALNDSPFQVFQMLYLETPNGSCTKSTDTLDAKAVLFVVEIGVSEAEIVCTPATFDFAVTGDDIQKLTYDWGNGSPKLIGGTSNPAFTYLDGGEYDVVVEAESGEGCMAKDTVSIRVVTPEPVFVFTPDTKTLCYGEVLTIKNSTPGSATIVLDWGDNSDLFQSDSFEDGDSTSHLYVNNSTNPQPVVLRMNVDLGFCNPVNVERTLMLEPQFAVTIQPSEEICLKQSTPVIAESQASNVILYRWESLDGSIDFDAAETITGSNTLVANSVGTKDIQVTAVRETSDSEKRKCKAQAQSAIVVHGAETDVILIGSRLRCIGETGRLEASHQTGLSYAWYFSDQEDPIIGTDYNVTREFNKAGNIEIVLEMIDEKRCTTRTQLPFGVDVVDLMAFPNAVPEHKAYCIGEVARIESNAPSGAKLLWKVFDTRTQSLVESSSTTATDGAFDWEVTLPNNGTFVGYDVELTVELFSGCIRAAQQISIAVPDLPAFAHEIDFTNGPCPPTVATIELISTSIQDIQWDFNNDGSIDASGNTFIWNAASLADSPLRVLVSAKNAAGCAAETLLVVSLEPPLVLNSIEGPDRICKGENGNWSIATVNALPIIKSQWSFGDGATTTSNPVSHAYDEIGQYTIKVVAQDALGCMAEQEKAVDVTAPTAYFDATPPAGIDTVFFPPKPFIQITDKSVGEVLTYIWQWSHLTISSASPSLILPVEEGKYTLVLKVTDKNACFDTLSKTWLLAPAELVTYSVFTPNGDGINDQWVVFSRGDDPMEVFVLDRTGVQVFQFSGIGNAHWDGTQQGKPVSPGTYFYRIKVGNIDRTGSLTLIR